VDIYITEYEGGIIRFRFSYYGFELRIGPKAPHGYYEEVKLLLESSEHREKRYGMLASEYAFSLALINMDPISATLLTTKNSVHNFKAGEASMRKAFKVVLGLTNIP
jgi:hypothetical protein